jgi:hypothetical protein
LGAGFKISGLSAAQFCVTPATARYRLNFFYRFICPDHISPDIFARVTNGRIKFARITFSRVTIARNTIARLQAVNKNSTFCMGKYLFQNIAY